MIPYQKNIIKNLQKCPIMSKKVPYQKTFPRILKTVSYRFKSRILVRNFHKSLFSIKSRLIFIAFYYRHTTQKFVRTKTNTYSNENECIEYLKMNAYM